MLAYDENNRIEEFRDTPGLKVCRHCHRIYRSIAEEQVPGFREKEDDVCPYCGDVNWQSMSYDFFNSKLNLDEISRLERESLIWTVMEYCDRAYLQSSCKGCNHYNGCPNIECPKNCKTCLEEIHYPRRHPNGKKDYDCSRLLDFYVCDYSVKYASEMLYLIHQSEMLKVMDYYLKLPT